MNYSGKLYGRIVNKYFDTGRTSDDWDNLERKVAKLEKENTEMSLRTQLSNGESEHLLSISERIDKHVEQLTHIQIELMQQKSINADDFNVISEMISNLKDYMVNCSAYNSK